MGTPRVLVVEDDRDLCDLLSDLLIGEGYAVTKAYGGRDAIDSARHTTPDAVLLDLTLPDISGLMVGRALRELTATRDVPIVIISGDRAALERGAADLGAHAFLEKPLTLTAVQAAVELALAGGSGQTGTV